VIKRGEKKKTGYRKEERKNKQMTAFFGKRKIGLV
jgi:hypothetical protein